MKTLSISVGKEGIKNLVVEWLELLAQEKYSEALDFIVYDNTQIIDGQIWDGPLRDWKRLFLHTVCRGSQRRT